MAVRRARGFTLIELMIAVAVIGLLSSVAVPSFRLMQLRAKQAERKVITAGIVRSIDELWVREGRFPWILTPASSILYLAFDNPDASPSASRRGWRYRPLNNLDHWNHLALHVEGGLFYSYGGWAQTSGNVRIYYVYSYGDLDGDGVQNRWEKEWYYLNGVKQTWNGTLPCPECSVAWEQNPGAW